MAGRPILALVSLILVAAACLFQLFVVLSGGIQAKPIPSKFYYLAADTTGMGSAPSMSAWTFFAVCSVSGVTGTGTTSACSKVKAANPFSPQQNFGTTMGIPPQFIGTHKWYYLSRFVFAFFLVSLFFAACALFTGLMALCTRIGSYLSGALTFVALGFQALTAALMTAFVVQGRNAFRKAGHPAAIGRYTMAFTWAAVAALFLATVLFCVGGAVGKKDKGYQPKKSRFGAFGRKRSTRSRNSYGDTETDGIDNGRVKDEYGVL